MNFKIKAKGHKNVLSKHKSTFEITKDKELSLSGDCIIGLDIEARDDTQVIVKLSTANASDEIMGWGHHDLILTHPTDLVFRKSTFTCPRTLMIKADKAAADLNRDLINDLSNGEDMDVEIILI